MCYHCHTLGHNPSAPFHNSENCRDPRNAYSRFYAGANADSRLERLAPAACADSDSRPLVPAPDSDSRLGPLAPAGGFRPVESSHFVKLFQSCKLQAGDIPEDSFIAQQLRGELASPGALQAWTTNQHFRHPPRPASAAAEKAVWMYTLNIPSVYKTVNRALLEDDALVLEAHMGLIRAISGFIKYHRPTLPLTSYRASSMDKETFDAFKVGVWYRLPMFVSTTEDENVAIGFQDPTGFSALLEFHVPADCWNGTSITHLSEFPLEKEVLLPPYTAVKVVRKIDNRIIFEVAQDNQRIAQAFEDPSPVYAGTVFDQLWSTLPVSSPTLEQISLFCQHLGAGHCFEILDKVKPPAELCVDLYLGDNPTLFPKEPPHKMLNRGIKDYALSAASRVRGNGRFYKAIFRQSARAFASVKVGDEFKSHPGFLGLCVFEDLVPPSQEDAVVSIRLHHKCSSILPVDWHSPLRSLTAPREGDCVLLPYTHLKCLRIDDPDPSGHRVYVFEAFGPIVQGLPVLPG